MNYTKTEVEAALVKMRAASSAFYVAACSSGCHAFIEFTGLMNEYIKVCERMTSQGDTSWMTANTHTDVPLALFPFEASYLAEKLDCIYGPSLRASEELRAAFEGHSS